jgi:hypothetical protein
VGANERAPRIAAFGLVLGLIGSPVVAESPKSPEHDPKYEFPMAILEEMVDIESPEVSEIYEKIASDPAQHIEIVDEFGYGENLSVPNGLSYFVFPDNQVEGEVNPEWSIAILVEDFNGEFLATVTMKMNTQLGVYKGRNDTVLDYAVPGLMLKSVAEDVFNEPNNLTQQPWEPVQIGYPMIGRYFFDENIGYFEQTISSPPISENSSENLISFTSNFPAPTDVNTQVDSDPALLNLPVS